MSIKAQSTYSRLCTDRDCKVLLWQKITKDVRDHGKTCAELPSHEEVREVFRKHEQDFKDICDEQFMYDRKGMTDLTSGCAFRTSMDYQKYNNDFLNCSNTGDLVIETPVLKSRLVYFDENFGSKIFGIPFRIIPKIVDGLPRGGTDYDFMTVEDFDLITEEIPKIFETYVKENKDGTIIFENEDLALSQYNKYSVYVTNDMLKYKNNKNIKINNKISDLTPSLELHRSNGFMNEYLIAAKKYNKKPHLW